MKERNIALSRRGTHAVSLFTEWLWWLATAEKEILADSVIDRNRYRIIGMTVLGTWGFATLSWTYFFFTSVHAWFPAVLLGFFMGFIILGIDRALIKGITRFNKRSVLPLIFRGLMALSIGTFMAQPALMYLFDKEIRLQTSLDNEKKKQQKRQELDLLFKDRQQQLRSERDKVKNELAVKYAAVEKARQDYLSETDGSGGTGKIGIKDIAIAKRNEYQKLDEEYRQLQNETAPVTNRTTADIEQIENTIKSEENTFSLYLNDGFLTRAAALNNLIKDNSALQFRYYLILFILVLIELMPLIAKTLLPSGSYDEKVMLQEKMEIALAHSNIDKARQLKEHYNRLAFEHDKEALDHFFTISAADRLVKMKTYSSKWKEDREQTFDGLWEKMKKDIFSKQEHG